METQPLRDAACRQTAIPKGVFDSTALRSAMLAATQALSHGAVLVVIVGEPGCGKSVLLQVLERTLSERGVATARYPLKQGESRPAVLLVDDADLADDAGLQAILAIARPIQLVLAGDHALSARLRRHYPRQFASATLVRMGGLLRQEVEQFIARRARDAKARDVHFTQAAFDRAFALSRGLPGPLDTLCLCARATGRRQIDAVAIDAAAGLCNLPDEAPATAAPHRFAAYRAGAVAAGIGIALGTALLMLSVGGPQAAESAAKLIRAVQTAAAIGTKPVLAQSETASPDGQTDVEPPRKEPESGMSIEPRPETDEPDVLPSDDEDDDGAVSAPEQTQELSPADPPLAESAQRDDADPPQAAPAPAAEAPILPIPDVPETSAPPAELAQPTAPEPPPAPSGATDARAERPSEPSAPEPAAMPDVARETTVSPAPPPRPAFDTAPLMARGQALLREGDIAGARLFFERAAAAHDPAAMTALARTYDPLELRRMGVLGMRGDASRALHWYRAAAEAGDAAAQQSIGRLSEGSERTR